MKILKLNFLFTYFFLLLIAIMGFACSNEKKELVEGISIKEDASEFNGNFSGTIKIDRSQLEFPLNENTQWGVTFQRSNIHRFKTYEIFRIIKEETKDTQSSSSTTNEIENNCPNQNSNLAKYQADSNCVIETKFSEYEGEFSLTLNPPGNFNITLETRSVNNFSSNFTLNGKNYNLRFGSKYSYTNVGINNPILIKFTQLNILLNEAIASIIY